MKILSRLVLAMLCMSVMMPLYASTIDDLTKEVIEAKVREYPKGSVVVEHVGEIWIIHRVDHPKIGCLKQ